MSGSNSVEWTSASENPTLLGLGTSRLGRRSRRARPTSSDGRANHTNHAGSCQRLRQPSDAGSLNPPLALTLGRARSQTPRIWQSGDVERRRSAASRPRAGPGRRSDAVLGEDDVVAEHAPRAVDPRSPRSCVGRDEVALHVDEDECRVRRIDELDSSVKTCFPSISIIGRRGRRCLRSVVQPAACR